MQKQKQKPQFKNYKNNRKLRNRQQKRSNWSQGGYKLANFNATEKFLFKFSTVINRSTTVSMNNLYVFRLNSLYDPDYTGAGKQPYMFDQVALLWNYYRVDKAKVTVTCTNTTTLPVTALMFMQPSTSVQSDSFDYFMQLPGCKSALLGPANSGTSVHQFKPFFAIPHQIMGLPKTDDTFRASYSNNPESVIYLFLGNQCEDLSTSNTVYYNVSIEFYTTMSGQYQQGDSIFDTLVPRLLENEDNCKKLQALLEKEVIIQKKSVKDQKVKK